MKDYPEWDDFCRDAWKSFADKAYMEAAALKADRAAVVYLDVYRTSGNEAQAIKAAGLNSTEYRMYATTATSSIDDAAAVIAGNIKAEKETSKRVAKKLGYASGKMASGEPVIFVLVKF